eukprot:4403037-Amphidinium_carterae.1
MIYHGTVGANDLLYPPPGLLVAERVGQEDSTGARAVPIMTGSLQSMMAVGLQTPNELLDLAIDSLVLQG